MQPARYKEPPVPSLRQLEYLVALADTRHFRRAAERTNTTQPTLSEQIKALEDRLGVLLIERSRAGALLTPTGARIVKIARRMIADASEITSIAAMDDGTPRGVLRIGLPSTIGPYLLPTVVPVLHRTYPDLKLYVREELPQTIPRTLEEGGYDMAIIPVPIRGDDFAVAELFREPLYLTIAADHPLARKPKVERTDLRGQEILTLGPGHQLHDVVLALCEEFGARVRLDYEGTSLDMLREMVITGLGITFMPGLYVRRELRSDTSLKILQLHGRSVYRTIGMVWRKTSTRGPMFEAITNIVRDTVQKEFGDLGRLG
jgi:LysR family hydrogen peroxide-inducible transcriptional activator